MVTALGKAQPFDKLRANGTQGPEDAPFTPFWTAFSVSEEVSVLRLFRLYYVLAGGTPMPAWSPEIANEFILLSLARGHSFDQMQLQKLVYIAHGWQLAFSDQPLTGDRPEAWSFGPVYRRLSEALSQYGRGSIVQEIDLSTNDPRWTSLAAQTPTKAELDGSEMETIMMVYEDYGRLSASQLATLTQRSGTPWAQVFAEGAGEFRDIPHHLIRAQFVEFAELSEQTKEAPRV